MTAATSTPMGQGSFLGRPFPRADGRLKVAGKADYALEHHPADAVHAVAVQSTVASGRVRAIDVTDAHSMPGVLRVFTHDNAPRINPCPQFPKGAVFQSYLPLQDDRVRFNGQHVALVVADTLERATEAAKRVRIEYEPGPAVVDMNDPHAEIVGPPESQGSDTRWGDPEGALAKAAVRIDGVYTTPREHNAPIEPHATIASWSQDSYLTVWEPSQWVEGARNAFSQWFGIPIGSVRVISPYVGGGFGSKVCVHPHAALAAMAARELKRPVKLAVTRPQNFTAHGGRPATRQKLALGADRDGRLQAIAHEGLNETSIDDSYLEPSGSVTKLMYAVPNFTSVSNLARVNSVSAQWMRAPGEAASAYALESAMDELAHTLNLDPIELRLRNWADADPETGKPWSTRRLREAYEAGARAFGWERRTPEPRSMRQGRRLVGWGMAGGSFPVLRTPAEARVRIRADGWIEVETSGAEIGNGTYTILAQTAAEVLGVPVEQVRVRLGDTALPRAPVAGGSQLANLLTGAVHKTALAARDHLLELAARDAASPLSPARPDDLTIHNGRIMSVNGSGQGVSIPDFLRGVGRDQIEVQDDTMPAGANSEEDRRATFGTVTRLQGPTDDGYASYSWCAQFAEVHVDEDFGTIRVSRMVGAFDCGLLYNPKLAESQFIGGMIMGIGQALLEAVRIDPRNGRTLNNNLGEYLMPVNADVPDIQAISVGEPDPRASALGGKTVGEIGIVGTAAAIANAVFHATGKRIRDLPITLDKLL